MNTKRHVPGRARYPYRAACAAWMAFTAAALAQTPVITDLGQGHITFTNASTNLEYRLQWSSTATGAANSSFDAIEYIAPTGASVSAPLPIFITVATTNALSNNVFRAHEHPFGIPKGTNNKATVQWSDNAGGPWFYDWNTALEVTPTSSVANAPTPHYYRITWINCPSNFCNCGISTNWSDATDSSANRTILYGNGKYYTKCMKVRVGQSVIFSNIPAVFPAPEVGFDDYPLRGSCQDYNGGVTNLDFGSVATFIFSEPGYFNYYAFGYGLPQGTTNVGMAGNIWVIP
jgi:hypothetical protein